ncbi:MAG: hypothetical protein COB23_08990 [Methylophaga sp.]|nr:MAG: hypothetical protein COB23_08990 [Methylophaga sp.]
MDIQSFSQSVRSLAKADDKKENGPIGPQVSELAQAKNAAKKQLNAAILESTINVNLTAGNDSQSLVLKTALEGINEALKETFGDSSIQAAYDAGVDVSPEATADRIVSLSTGFFSLYQQQHPELSQQEAVTAFVDIISGGIDTGFAEARDILTSLNVLQGDIASNIDKTYDLVQNKLQFFIDSFQ